LCLLSIFGLYTKKEIKYSLNKNIKSKDFTYVKKAQQDPKFFGYLYEKYFDQIFIYILKKVNNQDNAGEICSKVFLKAMLNIKKYKDMGYPFSSWLYKIASNETNKFFREQKKIQEVEIQEKDAVSLLEDINESNLDENIEKLLTSIEELNENQSELIELRFFEKLSFSEIGNQLGISSGNAKIRLYRAVDALKKQFNILNEKI
jgi:RNA polymerase sigma-70 factor, ECF subfamily